MDQESPALQLCYLTVQSDILPIINRSQAGRDNDEEHYEVLIKRQTKDYKNQGTPRNYVSIPIGSTVVVEWEQKWELHVKYI